MRTRASDSAEMISKMPSAEAGSSVDGIVSVGSTASVMGEAVSTGFVIAAGASVVMVGAGC